MKEERRVAVYLRVSSEEQARQGISLEAQLKKLEDYCEFKGWKIYKAYRDSGISGGSIKKRKGFSQMLLESKEKKFSAIIVTKIDRAFRNVMDALTTLEELGLRGIDFVSLAEDIDTTTPMGKTMFTIISAFAQLEREITVGRVRDVRKHKFDNGLFPARTPYGYKTIKKDGRIIGSKINEKEAENVRAIFRGTIQGKSYKEICTNLKINPQTYYNILKSKVYFGMLSFEKEERKGVHEPIITEEEWKKANEMP